MSRITTRHLACASEVPPEPDTPPVGVHEVPRGYAEVLDAIVLACSLEQGLVTARKLAGHQRVHKATIAMGGRRPAVDAVYWVLTSALGGPCRCRPTPNSGRSESVFTQAMCRGKLYRVEARRAGLGKTSAYMWRIERIVELPEGAVVTQHKGPGPTEATTTTTTAPEEIPAAVVEVEVPASTGSTADAVLTAVHKYAAGVAARSTAKLQQEVRSLRAQTEGMEERCRALVLQAFNDGKAVGRKEVQDQLQSLLHG